MKKIIVIGAPFVGLSALHFEKIRSELNAEVVLQESIKRQEPFLIKDYTKGLEPVQMYVDNGKVLSNRAKRRIKNGKRKKR